jgi:VWFA-related protein
MAAHRPTAASQAWPSDADSSSVKNDWLTVAIVSLAVLVLAANSNAAVPASAPESNTVSELSDPGLVLAAPSGSSWTIAKAVRPDFTIRRTVPEVRIQFTVADASDRLLQSLSKDDFQILDNRLSVKRVSSFSQQENLPLQIGMLLDVSDSVEKTRTREQQAVQYFVAKVLRPESDRVALLAFGSELREWQSSTGNRDELTGALSRIRQQGVTTYLYDAVYRTCLNHFSASRDQESAQRVLFVISDGMDTGSLHSLSDAISMALRRDVQIVAVSMHSRRISTDGDKVLQQLAEATGGRVFVIESEKDFPAVFATMGQQMRTKYSISFQPTEQTPGFHAVKIQVPGGDTVRVRARRGYYFDGEQNQEQK